MKSDRLVTSQERVILARVLAPYADRIERVGVFGSRATGCARPDSDIDLVLYGDIDPDLEARLWTLFDECDLAVEVDVAAYPQIRHDGLRKHIDETVRILFEKHDLRAPTA